MYITIRQYNYYHTLDLLDQGAQMYSSKGNGQGAK